MARLNLALAVGLVLSATAGCQAPERDTRPGVVQRALSDVLDEKDEARVIINLVRAPRGLPEYERHARTHLAQRNVRERAGLGFRVIHEFNHIPAIAGVLSREALQAVMRLDEVQYMQLDETGGGSLAEAVPSTGADRVRISRGLRGNGIRVAVLDSGASTTHPAIADSLVGQHCFTSAACPPNDTDEGTSAEDDENHGSNVTGIITSNGTGGISLGYAPDAEIVAVKVLDRDGRGWVSDWVSGLEWVYDNLASSKVRLINMSLDTDSMYSSTSACDAAQPAFANAAAELNAAGVTIFASSGNAGSTDSMSAPACNTGFIAVGATYDSQLGKQPSNATSYQALFGSSWPNCSDTTTSTTTMTCFTNSGGTRLDILAPGAILTSAGNGTSNTNYRGTSQASPAAVGIAALMLECNASLSPTRILEVLKATGQNVTDPRSGLMYPLIRAEAAVNEACPIGASTGGASATGGRSSTGGASGTETANGTGGRSTIGGMTSVTSQSIGGQSSAANTSAAGKPSGGQSNATASAGGSPAGGTSAMGDSLDGTAGVGGARDSLTGNSEPSDVKASCSCKLAANRNDQNGVVYPFLLSLLLTASRFRRYRRNGATA